jgi:ABC-type Fe3+-hydroxamate transport system substrate-binding protein
VSLVPSLTETVAVTAPGLVAGATDWCTHPAGLDVPRVRGTKNPDVSAVIALRPDVVLANEEENRPADLAALREAGLPVWVTVIRTLDEALVSLRRLLTIACQVPAPRWLEAAERLWAAFPPDVPGRPGQQRRAVIPIWRRPWMVLGRDTFAGDVLARLGVQNVYAAPRQARTKIHSGRARPRPGWLCCRTSRPFTAETGPSAPGSRRPGQRPQLLTWYSPTPEARTYSPPSCPPRPPPTVPAI